MKYLTPAICLGMFLATGPASAADLTIDVLDVKTANGTIMVALFDSADTFLKRPARAVAVPATGASVSVVFKDLPAAEYAFAAFQDANGNGELDKNPMGMPIEEFAFSNNAYGHKGPPAFDAAKVALPAAGARTSIKLR
jgi:uncharacterized protein (DUF2141 family)